MKIDIIKMPKGKPEEMEIQQGITLEELCSQLPELPYTILAAKVDNKLVDLNYRLDAPCKVELLDMRTQAANLIYQYSLSLIYVKAVYDVLGDVKVEIMNSLNKGLFTRISGAGDVSAEQIAAVEQRMRELVDANLPFEKEIVSKAEAIAFLNKIGRVERAKLLQYAEEKTMVKQYDLDGYKDFFYGLMTPSTGYIQVFELRKYNKTGVLLRFPHPSDPSKLVDYVDETKLYEAFGEQTKWDKILGVNYVNDLNQKIESGEYKELIQISEALHEKKIAEIADMIKQGRKRIILIAGPSSSGKTTFAQRLCIQLKVNGLNPMYMGTDDYFVEREDTPLDEHGDPDYENLTALDIDLFNQNMNDLLAGKEVDLPSFNFMTGHKEYGKRITSLPEGAPIVIEGIHGLNEELTKFIPHDQKFKIYISPLTQLNIDYHNRIPTTDERMLRRMVRDYLYRGHSAEDTILSWPNVRAGEDKNIFPYNGEADVLFNSYHVYEIAVLKKYAGPLLAEITQDSPAYADATRMLQFLDYFEIIEDDSIIVNNSIIREFIGGSIFVD